MKELEFEDRRQHAPPYDPTTLEDPEFIPFLERINAKPFAASVQCCIGHCRYDDDRVSREDGGPRWGYILLLMTGPSAVWLSEQVERRPWLIAEKSKMWGGKAGEMPSYTSHHNFMVAFAWDSTAWPTPAEEICALLDKYHAANPVEPPNLLNPDLPQRRPPATRRPSLDRLKRRQRRR